MSPSRNVQTVWGWLALWVVAAGLSVVAPDPSKRLNLFSQAFLVGSLLITLSSGRLGTSCAVAFLGVLALLNIEPRFHMPSFCNVPIGLWAGPLTLIVGLQLATGGVSLATLLLNLAGYMCVILGAAAAGAEHYVLGLWLGWAIVVLTALTLGWLRNHGRQRLADWCALAALGILVALGVFLPEVLYRLHPEWFDLPYKL